MFPPPATRASSRRRRRSSSERGFETLPSPVLGATSHTAIDRPAFQAYQRKSPSPRDTRMKRIAQIVTLVLVLSIAGFAAPARQGKRESQSPSILYTVWAPKTDSTASHSHADHGPGRADRQREPRRAEPRVIELRHHHIKRSRQARFHAGNGLSSRPARPCDRSYRSTGMRGPGRAKQHAMANHRGGKSQGQGRTETLQAVKRGIELSRAMTGCTCRTRAIAG